MKTIIAVAAIAVAIVGSALSVQAQDVKYDKPGVFDWNQFWDNQQRGG